MVYPWRGLRARTRPKAEDGLKREKARMTGRVGSLMLDTSRGSAIVETEVDEPLGREGWMEGWMERDVKGGKMG